jgi:HK97 gp10 family phage protein
MAKNRYFTKELVRIGRNEMAKRMQRATNIVKNQAIYLAPVDTGNLRNTIDDEITVSRNMITGKVSSQAKYAIFVEFGTGQQADDGRGKQSILGQKPQPFLRPALNNNIQKLKNIFTK